MPRRVLLTIFAAACVCSHSVLSAPPESDQGPHVNSSITTDPSKAKLTGIGELSAKLEGGAVILNGYCSWKAKIDFDTDVSKDKIETRVIQEIRGEMRRIYRNPPAGKTGEKYKLSSYRIDGEQPADTSDSKAFYFSSADPPNFLEDASVFKKLEVDLEFITYIQYRYNGGQWKTLLKGTWTWAGSGTVTYSSSGIPDSIDGTTLSTTTANFTSSTDKPTATMEKPNPDDPSNWTQY